jgi:uncharacterized damage-inducible protein DinB
MATEIEDLTEHYTRYREVTLEHLERFDEDQLAWRPRPDAFSCGQQFVHLIQTEDFYMRGLFEQEWVIDRLRFPAAIPDKAGLKQQFGSVRAYTNARFATLTVEQLSAIVPPLMNSPIRWSLRSWLWYVLEHEMHHKAQIAEYMRAQLMTPPFFAMVLPDGQRPDIEARASLGGI